MKKLVHFYTFFILDKKWKDKRTRIIRSIGETFRRGSLLGRKTDDAKTRPRTNGHWRGTVARALQHSPEEWQKSMKRYRIWQRPRNESLVFVTYNDYNGTESTTIPVHQACGLKPLERGENEKKPVYTIFGNCYHAASTTRQRLARAHLCAWKVRIRFCASRNSKKSRKKVWPNWAYAHACEHFLLWIDDSMSSSL